MGCNILSFAISPVNWCMRILLLVPPISCPNFWHPLGCQVELESTNRNCYLYSHVYAYLTGPRWPHLYTPWHGGTGANFISSFSACLIGVFLSFLWFAIKYSVSSLPVHYFEIRDCMSLWCERREKKLETAHITKTEVKWAGTLCFLSQQTLTVKSHKWMLYHISLLLFSE
jgi:hypothetical protein